MTRHPPLPLEPTDEAGTTAHGASAPPAASTSPPAATPGVVAAAASRTVLAVGPTIASLTDPCLAVAREGVLLAFACRGDEADAAWRLAARLARQGAVALPLWPEADDLADVPSDAPANASASEALVARTIEDFGRLDGVLVVADGNAHLGSFYGENKVGQAFQPALPSHRSPGGEAAMRRSPTEAAVGDLLCAVARRLGRGVPRVLGRFVVVWLGEPEGLVRLRDSLAACVADGHYPGAGRYWEMHVTAWPANAAETLARRREWAGWLCPAHTAASVPEKPADEKH